MSPASAIFLRSSFANPRARRKAEPKQELPPVALPAVINGQILPGEVDRIRFTAQRGQRVLERRARHLLSLRIGPQRLDERPKRRIGPGRCNEGELSEANEQRRPNSHSGFPDERRASDAKIRDLSR